MRFARVSQNSKRRERIESLTGSKTEALAELRKFRALIDDVVGTLRRRLLLADEEEDEAKRLEMRKQIFKDQNEFMECMKQIRDKIKEINSDISKEAS